MQKKISRFVTFFYLVCKKTSCRKQNLICFKHLSVELVCFFVKQTLA